MSKISEALIWPLFFIIIILRVADISIANLDTPRNYLNETIIFMLPVIIIFNAQLVSLEFYKRIAPFFLLPISILIVYGEARAFWSLVILLLESSGNPHASSKLEKFNRLLIIIIKYF